MAQIFQIILIFLIRALERTRPLSDYILRTFLEQSTTGLRQVNGLFIHRLVLTLDQADVPVHQLERLPSLAK